MEQCKLCNREFKSTLALTSHLSSHHITSKEYYDKFLKVDENEGICPVCGKETKFKSITTGYKEFCSVRCAKLSPKTQEKYEKTCMEKYGITSPFNSDKAKEKRINTNLKKFGAITPLGNKDIQNKIKQNNIAKFGVEYPLQSPEIHQKTKETLYKNFGVDNPGKSLELIQKRCDTVEAKRKEFEISNNLYRVKNVVDEYGQGWVKQREELGISFIVYSGTTYISQEDKDKAQFYYEKHGWGHKSWAEKELHDYLSSIYNGTILSNTRTIIDGLELDFYLPDVSIAIEFNGSYFHSYEVGTPINYHFNKSIECEKRNIRLFHIYEYEWVENKEYIKTLLCREISPYLTLTTDECNIILKDYGDLIAYDLIYNNQLVKRIEFTHIKLNQWKGVETEIENNILVVNGNLDIIQDFILKYKPQYLKYYCDFNKPTIINNCHNSVYTGPIKRTVYKRKSVDIKTHSSLSYKNINTIYDCGFKIYEWRDKG